MSALAPKTRRGLGRMPAEIAGRMTRWLAAQPSARTGWQAVSIAIGGIVLLPVLAILTMAMMGLIAGARPAIGAVLGTVLYETVLLVGGVAILTGLTGGATAWLVTMYRFPGRSVLDRLLVLPLAMPTYIVAYCYVELLDFAGPVQTALRDAFAWKRPSDYWFPDVRSICGGIFVMSAVLYPYVYLAARASFAQQSSCTLEVARTLGRTPLGVLGSVALPLARPALVAGIVLAMLECVNDLGAVQHLGIRTLSTSIYTSWLQRNDLVGAVQIAAILMLIVLAILAIERSMRGGGRGHVTTTRYRSLPFETLTGWWSVAALAACIVPVLIGFVVPVAILVRHALLTGIDGSAAAFWIAVRNSIGLAAAASVVTVLLAIALIGARRAAKGSITAAVGLLAGLGYALPGTVLAIGLMRPLGAFDNWIGYGLLISGSLAAVVLAYVIRFMAVALGPIEDGQSRISPNLDAAARTLGANELGALIRIQLPMMIPALGSATLVVFVDSMKELPATLLLRPLGFSTLATEVFNLAALEQIEASAAYALTIVAAGLIPVLLLHRAIASGRAGG